VTWRGVFPLGESENSRIPVSLKKEYQGAYLPSKTDDCNYEKRGEDGKKQKRGGVLLGEHTLLVHPTSKGVEGHAEKVT